MSEVICRTGCDNKTVFRARGNRQGQRPRFITPPVESELHPYMAKIFRALESRSLAIDGPTDNVHILFSLSRVVAIANLVEEVKTESSKWIKTKENEFRNFHWQAGYGAFAIGPVAGACPEASHRQSEATP